MSGDMLAEMGFLERQYHDAYIAWWTADFRGDKAKAWALYAAMMRLRSKLADREKRWKQEGEK